jgi:transposase
VAQIEGRHLDYSSLTCLLCSMANRLDSTTIARIEDALRDPTAVLSGQYIAQLAIDFGCHISTIYRHKLRIEARRPVLPPSGGAQSIITPRMEVAIKLLLDQEPWLYQDEIADFILEAYDVFVDQSTVSRALKRIEVTRKRLKVLAAQRNQELRDQWQLNLLYFSAEQLVCVDESGSDERTGDRHYGWADRGARAEVHRWLAKKERVSVLPAYTIEGYITARTFKGTCTGDIFEEFIIEQVLPLCNEYPGPRSVIVLDNASVHHSNKVRILEVARRRGVWVRFLPPYSPDFNPIEESFGDLKAYIRRYYRTQFHKFHDYQAFLEWAIRKVGTGPSAARRARAHFRNAGVQGVLEN